MTDSKRVDLTKFDVPTLKHMIFQVTETMEECRSRRDLTPSAQLALKNNQARLVSDLTQEYLARMSSLNV